jgi:hypothetical protein
MLLQKCPREGWALFELCFHGSGEEPDATAMKWSSGTPKLKKTKGYFRNRKKRYV